MRADVLLFDGLHFDASLMATIKLPLRLRPGYRGSWATAARIERAAIS